ncbi:MAG: hypothetical protein COA82_09855 [Alkaliphilus sp.]|nr:hypothetical protein [bacterium AH-315-E09]PHS31772.1 MAG: hypothetical protein COA82_09855 [Alkaliphilus sp.]
MKAIKHERKLVRIKKAADILYAVPQHVDINSANKKIVLYFRVKEKREHVVVHFKLNGEIVFTKKYKHLSPPEMERIEIKLRSYVLAEDDVFEIVIE